MKLLFDENLSEGLIERLGDLFPDSTHVRRVGLQSALDTEVWKYAAANQLIIVSKDSDIHDLSLLYGEPPKVIWIRTGNCSTREVAMLLRSEFDLISRFALDSGSSLLVIK